MRTNLLQDRQTLIAYQGQYEKYSLLRLSAGVKVSLSVTRTLHQYVTSFHPSPVCGVMKLTCIHFHSAFRSPGLKNAAAGASLHGASVVLVTMAEPSNSYRSQCTLKSDNRIYFCLRHTQLKSKFFFLQLACKKYTFVLFLLKHPVTCEYFVVSLLDRLYCSRVRN